MRKQRVSELLGHPLEVPGVLQLGLKFGDAGVLLVQFLAQFRDPVLSGLFLLAYGLEFGDEVLADGFEFGALEVVQTRGGAGVEGLLAVELHPADLLGPVGHHKCLAVV